MVLKWKMRPIIKHAEIKKAAPKNIEYLLNKPSDVVPDFGSSEYIKMFGEITPQQYAAYNAQRGG